ncbi:bacillithiol system redox-active protein YtxJ [Neobacillus sp. PS3-40]|uniref:bacillithiol system redox-active protein YtxJ n=1 Tax=Neobacillus sp. PS3-40 TaxID=3070679 RepID=UPI0027DF5D76|nr:bacillithiol system redox-active protein YtxJ [Neobacillus sp. PS3-40]WML45682.1 bacillithiol system redox-active protein YtxJ [Neobacillus sp. PS3-40]
MEKIDEINQFDNLVKTKNKFFLLKHSITCPVSQAAYQEYQKFADDHKDIPTYFLTVQDSRPLSNEIADKYQIKHESPQAILFSNTEAVWHASHWKIKNQSLASAFSDNE